MKGLARIDRLDIVAPMATALMQSNPDPNDPDQMKIKELIDMLTIENGDDAQHRRRIRELADYRSYFRFSIDICDPEQATAESRISSSVAARRVAGRSSSRSISALALQPHQPTSITLEAVAMRRPNRPLC
ncbi:hypothetical protein GGD63_002451 [Bradyrhizobium sp. cir1]|uniref:hypothetical protein n=1 Tax=Bradyrhizobium sp. cir1 TaxID=1445730 RepID=UPI0017EBE40E|nr:hypothetical protein [Bradyrhizobium sp. cir1]